MIWYSVFWNADGIFQKIDWWIDGAFLKALFCYPKHNLLLRSPQKRQTTLSTVPVSDTWSCKPDFHECHTTCQLPCCNKHILYQFVIVQPHSHSLCGALEIGGMKGQVLLSYYIFVFQAFSNLKARKGKYSKEVPIKTENNNFQFGDLKKKAKWKNEKIFLLLFPSKTTFWGCWKHILLWDTQIFCCFSFKCIKWSWIRSLVSCYFL